jgi:hypothetical protein
VNGSVQKFLSQQLILSNLKELIKMALKSDRFEFQTDVSFFMNEVAERGGIVVLPTGSTPSGAAMDSAAALVSYASNPSGLAPIGLLLNDMVNLDLTRQHINWHKNEIQKGGKVTILRKGYVVTNRISTSGTPVAGNNAYVADSGLISTSVRALVLDSGAQPIGRFLSAKDADGYAKVEINLP